MNVVSVRCQHCGAPLSVDDSTRFLTCTHCGSDLEIKHSESTVYTSLVQAVMQNTQRIGDHLERLSLYQDLESLDREWEMKAKELGSFSENESSTAQVIGGAVLVCILIFWTFMALTIFPPSALLGVGGLLFLFVNWTHRSRKRQEYLPALRQYQAQRRQLLIRLNGGAVSAPSELEKMFPAPNPSELETWLQENSSFSRPRS